MITETWHTLISFYAYKSLNLRILICRNQYQRSRNAMSLKTRVIFQFFFFFQFFLIFLRSRFLGSIRENIIWFGLHLTLFLYIYLFCLSLLGCQKEWTNKMCIFSIIIINIIIDIIIIITIINAWFTNLDLTKQKFVSHVCISHTVGDEGTIN